MKLPLYYRSILCLLMTLIVCHPLQTSASTLYSIEKNSDLQIVQGKLENGLRFTLIPSTQLKGGLWTQLSCLVPQEENETALLLNQHAAFYGTEQFNHEELATHLNQLRLDIEADSFIRRSENETSLQFSLSEQNREEIELLLQILQQMVLHPTLTYEEIEIARNHLLSKFEQERKDSSPLQTILAAEIRAFHEKWYHPEKMNLTIVGFYNQAEMVLLIEHVFSSSIAFQEEIPFQETKKASEKKSEDNPLAIFTNRIELASDNLSWIVDGKIWMKQPNWINTKSKGRTLGTVLTVLGVAALVVGFPMVIIAPAAIIAGSLGTATGVYFLTCDYFRDPAYIETIRQTDLQKGCAYAYQKHHAGLTLTPFERRASFIQEMAQQSHTLPKLPILLLADLYQLNDPIIADLFTQEEFTLLTRIKGDFIQQRNQYKMLKHNLEQELASAIAPYALIRDVALLQAQSVYNQNTYVIANANLKLARDKSISDVEQAFKKGIISLSQKEEMLEQAQSYYQSSQEEAELKAGLEAAKSNLSLLEFGIHTAYTCQVEICKNSMQYNQRMEQFKMGEKSLVHYFNEELVALLSHFPVYLTDLPDYLDLRGL